MPDEDAHSASPLSGQVAGAPEHEVLEWAEPALPAQPRRALVDRVVEAISVLCLLAVVLLLFLNATGRYLLDRPIGWAEEAATSLVLWITMLGMFITVRRRELITVRHFVRLIPERARPAVQLLIDLLTAAIFGYLAWYGVQYVLLFGGDRTPYLGLTKGFFTAAIPIGAAAVALAILVQLRDRSRP